MQINKEGKIIWVVHPVKELPVEIVTMADNLSKLDFITFIRLTKDSVSASNEIKGSRIKIPVTEAGHPTATGIKSLFDCDYKILIFDEINSPVKGNGSRMVNSILIDFPKDWEASVVMDWSCGFWDKMKDRFSNISWIG